MAIKTRALIDVQCDLCQRAQTLETEKPAAQLDALGYRKVKIAVEPMDPGLASELGVSTSLVVCKECLGGVKRALKLQTPEDAAELELERMKQSLHPMT